MTQAHSRGEPQKLKLSMLIDLAKCIGCGACTLACKLENSVPGDILWAPVLSKEAGKLPNARIMFLPTLCMHCEDPPCLKSCPSKAITKRPDGIVIINEEKCCGAQACVSACPYNAITVWTKDNLPLFGDLGSTSLDLLAQQKHRRGAAQKCTFCSHRIDLVWEKNLKPGIDREATPACVLACPAECRIFGDMDDPNSKPYKYMKQAEVESRKIYVLRPNAKTRPKVAYVQ